MHSNQITRCPDCNTAFQVTNAQLEAAQGSVRCGSCLHIFDARECLLGGSSDEFPAKNHRLPGNPDLADPDTQQLSDPAHGPQILSLVANMAEPSPEAAATAPGPAKNQRSKLRVQLPDSITRGVLELQAGQARQWPRRMAWITVNLVLLLALVAQFGYLYFDAWRSHAWTGPWIERGCAYVRCPAPRRNDLDLLTTSELRVRSHPERVETLIVELTVRNRAAFSQPFPSLEIEFIDVIGGKVESRRIPPQSYQPDYDAEADFLPAKSSALIMFETPDPGDHAANYTLRMHPATGT